MSKCNACKLCETTDNVCIMGTGPKRAKIMVVGEAPGAEEEEYGKPFMGKAGKLLTRLMKEAGLKRKDVYTTNAVHCRPPDNKTPTKSIIKKCRPWLDKEIKRVKPKFVILLGNTALESITGSKGIKKARGKPIEQDGIIFLPTYHPAFVLRDKRMEPVLLGDLRKFVAVIDRGGPRKESGLQMRVVTSENLGKALRDISRNKVVSFDCETSGLDPFLPGSWVTSSGIGTRTRQWCFPLQHTESWLFNKPKGQRRVVRRLGRALKGNRLVAHNGKFDTKWVAHHFGEWWYVDFDTMLAHYNLDENALHGLDILSQRFLGAMDYDIPLKEKHGFGPLKRHCEYLALDVYYTRKLYFKFKKEMKKDPDTKIIFDRVTMPVSHMYARAETRGIYVNPKRLKKAHRYWKKKGDKALKKLTDLCPSDNSWKDKKTKEVMHGINWNSPDQVATVLFDNIGLKSLEETPGGKRAVNESVLLRLAHKHKVPKLILAHREASKMLGFVVSWQKRAINNRIHPNFKIHGTVTGRPSCEEPNLQQVPRIPEIRGIFDAAPGWVLISADFSQIELRIVAEMSRDEALTFEYQTGGDVHTKTVQTIFGIMKPSKEERKKGKAINFGFIYGMWWKKFMDYARDNFGIIFTPQEAERIRKEFFRLYHGITPWHKKQKRFANTQGYVRSLLGRIRRLPDALARDDSRECKEAERQAINSPVQSFASDLNLTAAVELEQKLPDTKFRIVSTTHDEILAEVKIEHLMSVAKEIKKTMENPSILDELNIELSIPIEAELEKGPWGNGEEMVFTKKAA